MPDPTGPPDPPREPAEPNQLLRSVSREMVATMKNFYGKGPDSVRSYFIDDLLFVVMRGGMTVAEDTMLKANQSDAVREFRQRFENEMGDYLVGAVEQLTQRKVVNYQSQILFDPDMIIEIFVFDGNVSEDVRKATASAVLRSEPDIEPV